MFQRELPTGVEWSYTTRRIRLLSHDFAIRSTHPGIGRYFDDLYDASIVRGEPSTWYSIITGLPGSKPHALDVDRERVVRTSRSQFVTEYLFWHINREAIDRSCADYVLVHAAAAARNGVGIVLPAASEAGKTTLVGGLVSAGFNYLTDEAAAIHPVTLRLVPFEKPLSVDKGSWEVLAHLEPRVEPEIKQYLASQWQVPPLSIRSGSVSGAVPARLVVFPRYSPGGRTQLKKVSRSDALIGLLRHTFKFERASRRNFEVLARLAGQVSCYDLTVGCLSEACSLLRRLTDSTHTEG